MREDARRIECVCVCVSVCVCAYVCACECVCVCLCVISACFKQWFIWQVTKFVKSDLRKVLTPRCKAYFVSLASSECVCFLLSGGEV